MFSHDENKPATLVLLNYPAYVMKVISERHILIAGGGGDKTKSGISNLIEIYELIYNPETDSAGIHLVTRFDNENQCVMNIAIVPKSAYHFVLLSGGNASDGLCYVHDVKLKLKSVYVPNGNNAQQTPSDLNLRRRNFSFSTQTSKEEDVEDNLGGSTASRRNPSPQASSTTPPPNVGNPAQTARRDSSYRGSSNNGSTKNSIPEYTFEFAAKHSFQTDFCHSGAFQSVIKYSPSANLIISAGAEGVIRFWSVDYKEKLKIGAHEDDITDLDIHPAGTHLISVSSDGRSNVWTTSNGDLVKTLVHDQAISKHADLKKGIKNFKYNAKKCRYATVEGDQTSVRLFLLLNPIPMSTSVPSYIAKWVVDKNEYKLERVGKAACGNFTALDISDNGRFLATGYNTGRIDVFIAFSLQHIYKIDRAHSQFVSNVLFLPSAQTTKGLVGDDAETALISISGGDPKVLLHKVSKRATLGFFGSAWFFVVFMFCVYLMMNYLNL